jgi:hypothetical protein
MKNYAEKCRRYLKNRYLGSIESIFESASDVDSNVWQCMLELKVGDKLKEFPYTEENWNNDDIVIVVAHRYRLLHFFTNNQAKLDLKGRAMVDPVIHTDKDVPYYENRMSLDTFIAAWTDPHVCLPGSPHHFNIDMERSDIFETHVGKMIQ